MIRLLDRAIAQEETWLEKIKDLEEALANCRNTLNNPRHEVDEQALPASKVSFRLDFYQTENKGFLKGIVEHLPSRESRTFNGVDITQIENFIARFVQPVQHDTKTLKASQGSSKKGAAFPPQNLEASKAKGQKERPPLLKILLPDFFGTPTLMLQQALIPDAVRKQVLLGLIPFSVLIDAESGNQRAVHKGQPFQIEIPMTEMELFWDKPCKVSLTAVSLEKDPHPTLNTFAYCFPKQEQLLIPIHAFKLELGMYRLTVSMSLRDEPGRAKYAAQRLLIVQ